MSRNIKNQELSDKQRQAIIELVGGAQKQEAAKAVDVEPETLSRWLSVPEFEAALNDARQDAYAAGIQRQRRLQHRALDELEQQFEDEELEAKDRRRLAMDVLKLSERLPVPSGQTDPDEIRKSAELAKLFDFDLSLG